METQERIQGVVATAKKTSVSNAGWHKWTVVFKDGNTYQIIIPPDLNTYSPKEGDNIGFIKGAYNSLVIDRDTIPGLEKETPAAGSAEAGTSRKTEAANRDEYWKQKEEYERLTRDPKIEWQTYFNSVKDFYIAALDSMTTKPTNIIELDAFIDDAIAKADSIFARRNKK